MIRYIVKENRTGAAVSKFHKLTEKNINLLLYYVDYPVVTPIS